MADERVVGHHGKVARHLQLVAAADADPVDPRHRRLPDLAQPVVCVLERAEPLPILARVAEVVGRPRLQVRAHAERATCAGQDDDADLVVPGSVLRRPRQLAQHLEVEGVQHLRPVERDRRAVTGLLVPDALEPELGRVDRERRVGFAHASSANSTLGCGKPRLYASLPVAMNSSLRVPVLNASSSANSHSA